MRAAAQIADDDEIVVLGSQSILGQFPAAPEELRVSEEADLYPKNRPERWELIDGTLGELSPFHQTFGYYAQGVGPQTATLPRGWQDRLVLIENANTRGAKGWCLELGDLLCSKYVAGRDKDRVFGRAVFRHRLMDPEVVVERLAQIAAIDEDRRAALAAQIRADASGSS